MSNLRTDIQSVKDVMDVTLTDAEIKPFIIQANAIITSRLSGEGLPDTLLKDIETWFAAHLISITKQRQTHEEKVGDIWVRYQMNPAGFLNQSTYGQTVLFLDTSGRMQEATKQKAWIKATKQ